MTEWRAPFFFHEPRDTSVITTAPPHRSSGAPAGRNGWSGGELCSGLSIEDPVPRRLVSANFENASRIRDFGYVRFFGHDEFANLMQLEFMEGTAGFRPLAAGCSPS